MKIRRFVKKRRQRELKRFTDLMSAKSLGRADREELHAFRKWLRQAPRIMADAQMAERLAQL